MQLDLKPGDEVLVEIPGRVADDGAIATSGTLRIDPDVVIVSGGRIVLTRDVDHPSRDLPGTVRESGWVKVDSANGTWWNVLTLEERTGDDVDQHPVIGAMPGTPAATPTEPVTDSR